MNSMVLQPDDSTALIRRCVGDAFGERVFEPGAAQGVAMVNNKSSGAPLAQVAVQGAADAVSAVAAAQAAMAGWRALLPRQRGDLLLAWHERLLAEREELARLITLEQGKPLAEALGEVDYGADFVRWFAEEASRGYGRTIPSHLPGAKLLVQREPVGVVAAITPWNFPLAMLTRKAAAALAAGCTVVGVPSMMTPLTALALQRSARAAGLPEGAFSVLLGEPPVLVETICADARVRAVSFTGSTEVGRIIQRLCAGTVKRVSLELGGHAPFIVFDDADVDAVAAAAVTAKFQTSGQDCLAANRIYVQRGIYATFVERFAALAAQLRVGDGFDNGVEIGPLIDGRAVAKARAQVDDALAKGARLLAGGGVHARGGLFFEPTVLADVGEGMRILDEETFAPVAALLPFDDETAVIAAANASEYGLMAYVYTNDIARGLRVCDALEYGMVGLNRTKVTGPPIPFGGVKQSGLGREGAHEGLEEFTELKYISIGM